MSAALRYARDFFESAALFAVTRDAVWGHEALGPDDDARERCRALAVSVDDAGLFRPALEETARALAGIGVERTPEEIGEATARVAWATGAWMLLLHTMTSLFAGLWTFSARREPGLFGRQFRDLRLGSLVAWVAGGALLASLVTQWASGRAWAPAEDVLFVLAGAFLLQALAVVHGLRAAQAIGPALVVLAYAVGQNALSSTCA